MASESLAQPIYCRCGHTNYAHRIVPGTCLPRVGVTCVCREFRETRSNMRPSAEASV